MFEDVIAWWVEGTRLTGGFETLARIEGDSRNIRISHIKFDLRETGRKGKLCEGVDQARTHALAPRSRGDPHRNEPATFWALRVGAESNDAHVFLVDDCDECGKDGELLNPALGGESGRLIGGGAKRIGRVEKRSQTNAPQALFFSGAQPLDSHNRSIVEPRSASMTGPALLF